MDIDLLGANFEEEKKEDLTAGLAAQRFSTDDLGFFKYARWLIYALVFLVPLFFLPWTSEILEFNKQLLIFAVSGVALILYLAQIIKTGHLVIRRSPFNYAVLIFLASVLIVSIFSDFKYQSVFGGFGAGFYQSLISAISFGVFFFVAFNVLGFSGRSVKEETAGLLNIFGLSVSLALLFGVLEIFGVPVFKILGLSLSQSFNTVGSINTLGIMAALLLVFSISKTGFTGQIFGYLRLPVLFLSLFILLLFNWWVLWVIAISGLVLVLVSNLMSDWKISNYFWPSVIIVLGVVFLLLNFSLTGLFGTSLPVEIAPSFGTSFEIARNVLMKDPFFGVGPENFQLAYDLYRSQSINDTVFWNIRFSEATSEIFSTAVSLGLVGLAGFLFLIWLGLKAGFKNHNLLPFFAVLVTAWVLYPFNLVLGFTFWFLVVLLALSSSKKDDDLVINLEKSPRHSLITSVSFVGIMILAVIGFYFTTLRYIGDIKFVQALNESDPDRQTELLVEAVNLVRGEDTYSRALGALLVNRISQEVQNIRNAKNETERQDSISRVQNFSASAINLMNGLTQRHGQDSANWFTRAQIYESLTNIIEGSDQWAITMYQEHSKLSPKDPTPYFRMGAINLNRAEFLRQLIAGAQNLRQEDRINAQNQIFENLKMAEENYIKAIELKPDYILAIYNLGVVYEREGRVADAVKQLEITRSANPLDSNLTFQLGLLYYRDGQKDKSFSELQRAVTIFPGFSNARWYLALLYEERGDLDSALNELYKIEELNPGNDILLQKISDLEKGRRSIPPQRVTGVQPLEQEGADKE